MGLRLSIEARRVGLRDFARSAAGDGDGEKRRGGKGEGVAG